MIELSDGALIRASTEGDRDAFRVLFERHVRVVRAYVIARSGGADVDDAVVETFEVAWRRRADFDATAESARPWLLGIATFVMRGHDGARRRWHHGLEQVAPAADARSHDRSPTEALDPVLVAAITQLRPSERSVLLLVAVGELSVAEAARVLDISQTAARVRLHRARRTASAYIRRHQENAP